jgi:hypothetical protein
MIIQYLVHISNKGTIAKPTGSLLIDCYVDANFAALYGKDPDASRSSTKLHLGAPLVWKSQLIQEISLSTTFAKYNSVTGPPFCPAHLQSYLGTCRATLCGERDSSDDTGKSF